MLASTFALILGVGAIAFLALGISYGLGPARSSKSLTEAIFVFVAFFFLLLGLSIMFAGGSSNANVLLGDLFASLALTFFWVMRKKPS
jgi:hypothetical protein